MTSKDAGAWSLLGYMYQLVGSAAARISLEDGAITADRAEAVLVEVEEHGQDAVATVGDRVELIQFKHSGSRRTIGPKELAEVLKQFEASTASVGCI